MAKFYLVNYSGEYVKDIRIQNCRRKKKARYFYTPCLLEEEALAFKDNWTAHTFSGLLNCSVKEGAEKV